MEIMRFWLLHFLDWKRSTPLLRTPGSRSWLGFPCPVRTLNCPLFLKSADGNRRFTANFPPGSARYLPRTLSRAAFWFFLTWCGP